MNTTSLTESKSSVYLIPDKGEEVIRASTDKVKYSCIQVMAYIKDGPINEYVAYDPYYVDVQPGSGGGSSSDGKSSGKNKTFYIIIGVGVGLLVIIIVLIVIILVFNAKNKNLIDKVNKVSFVSIDNKSNTDSNLLVDDNELQ